MENLRKSLLIKGVICICVAFMCVFAIPSSSLIRERASVNNRDTVDYPGSHITAIRERVSEEVKQSERDATKSTIAIFPHGENKVFVPPVDTYKFPISKRSVEETTAWHSKQISSKDKLVEREKMPVTQYKGELVKDISNEPRCRLLDRNLTADCSKQRWKTVPSGLPTNITNLNLTQNYLTCLEPKAFREYPLLRTLNLSRNHIKSITEHSFMGLNKLKILDLGRNFLNFNNCFALCCNKPFSPLHNLSHLNIKRNNYLLLPTALDKCLEDLVNLKSLKVNFVNEARFGIGFQKLKKLKVLDMAGARRLTLIDVDFFGNLQNLPIMKLSLAQCNIKFIHPDAFSNFTVINLLDLSDNKNLGLENASIALRGINKSTIKVLYINKLLDPKIQDTIIVAPSVFENIQHTNLTELHMDFNSISKIEVEALLLLPQSLTKWSLRENKLSHPYHFLKPLLRLINLKVLDAAFQRAWAHGKAPNDFSPFVEPSSQTEVEISNKTVTIPVPPKLTTLIFTHADSYYYGAKYVKFVNSSLKYLFYTNNELYKFSVIISGLDSVEVMDLGYNQLVVQPGFFDGFPKLRALSLFSNRLNNSFARDRKGAMLGRLHNLAKLRLGNNGISKLFNNTFENNSLLYHLALDNNKLTRLGARIHHLTRLSFLDLSKNNFAYLDRSEILDLEAIAGNGKLKVNLKDNPLVCSCDTLAFLKWVLLKHNNINLVGFSQMSCLAPNGSSHVPMLKLKHIVKELEYQCASYIALILSLSLASLALIMILSGACVYRFRWKLRYIYHVRLLRQFSENHSRSCMRRGYTPINGDDPSEHYDVFVAYADEDRKFVVDDMRHALENQNRVKMYIRDRDSVGGFEIATNITRAVHLSSTTILLLSKNFLRNKWCYYEYQMAIQEGVDRRRNIFLYLMYEEIPTEEIPDEFLATMKSSKSVEVPFNTANPNDMETFWTMLVQAVTERAT